MRPYILAETNWKAVKDTSFELAILPWGATEAHNYHLPYGTDVFEAEAMAAAAAAIAWSRGAKPVVLPAMAYGVNTGQADILLDMNLNPTTQFAILCDIAQTLNRQEISKMAVFNSHGGNDFKALLRQLGLQFPEMFFCIIHCLNVADKKSIFENGGDHADEMETSLMLHLHPQLVLPQKEWGSGKAKTHRLPGFREGWAWAERKWSQVSEDTGIGNPALATADKGKYFFDASVQKIGEMLYELCKADHNDLYMDAP